VSLTARNVGVGTVAVALIAVGVLSLGRLVAEVYSAMLPNSSTSYSPTDVATFLGWWSGPGWLFAAAWAARGLRAAQGGARVRRGVVSAICAGLGLFFVGWMEGFLVLIRAPVFTNAVFLGGSSALVAGVWILAELARVRGVTA